MIGIGISTYNDYENTDKLLNSIIRYTNAVHGKDYSILVVDDGTKNVNTLSNLDNVCKKHGVRLIKNSTNKGIPYTWNRIVENCGNDIIFIFNNDILVANGNWLKCFEHFITKNDKIGTVGVPLINRPDYHISGDSITWNQTIESRWGNRPGRVGAAVGCSFGLKKEVWEKIKNPDGSIGFWEDLVSFHEEIHFGFKLSEIGYYNYMLNWPPMIHLGGQTFACNPELIERPVDWSKWNKQEYIDIIMNSKIYPPDWKTNGRIAWTNHQGIEVADRMAFSRYMFAKYWNVLSDYDMPQVPVHRRVIDPMPSKRVKWLDRNLVEQEYET